MVRVPMDTPGVTVVRNIPVMNHVAPEGQCEVAIELMCDRALERRRFGRSLADYANVQEWIAESRIEVDMARLLVLRAAWRLDTAGNQAARVEMPATPSASCRRAGSR